MDQQVSEMPWTRHFFIVDVIRKQDAGFWLDKGTQNIRKLNIILGA